MQDSWGLRKDSFGPTEFEVFETIRKVVPCIPDQFLLDISDIVILLYLLAYGSIELMWFYLLNFCNT